MSLDKRKPWLSSVCDLIESEVDLLESRGVVSAPRLDLAADIGMTVLEMVFENDGGDVTASPNSEVLKES